MGTPGPGGGGGIWPPLGSGMTNPPEDIGIPKTRKRIIAFAFLLHIISG